MKKIRGKTRGKIARTSVGHWAISFGISASASRNRRRASEASNWRSIPAHVDPKRRFGRTNNDGSAHHCRVHRLLVCRFHMPMALVALEERPLHLVWGSVKREIVQPFDCITTWMAVTVLKGAAHDCDNRSTRISDRLLRFRVLRADVATTHLIACACRSSPSS